MAKREIEGGLAAHGASDQRHSAKAQVGEERGQIAVVGIRAFSLSLIHI